MTFIKSIAAILLFMFILPVSILQAQEKAEAEPNLLQPGSKALMFQISENFSLESFSGSMISYKRQISEDRARRIGLSLFNRYNSVSSPDSDVDRNDANFDLIIDASYTWKTYKNPESDIKFYYGYGPGVGFGINRDVREQTGLERVNRSLTVAVEGLAYAGVEWLFHSSMSLHAEYGGSIRFQYTDSKNTVETSGDEEVSNNYITGINVGGNGVRFGLSVYF